MAAIVVLISLSFVFLLLIIFNPSEFLQLADTSTFSEASIIFVFLTAIACILHIFINLSLTLKFRLNIAQLVLLPSFVIPTLFVVVEFAPILWKIFVPDFVIPLIREEKLADTVILVCNAALALLTGMLISKFTALSNSKGTITRSLAKRKLDVLLETLIKPQFLYGLVIFSLFVAPFQIGWRLDLVLVGGRGENVENPLLLALIPLAGILSTMLTMFAGFCYARTNKPIVFLIVFADVLPRLVVLSRGFFIPIMLFIISATLLGKIFPKWLYVAAPVFSIIGGATALSARAVSSGGASGLASGFSSVQSDSSSSIQGFFESNTNLGIVSQGVFLRDPAQNPIDGFFLWLTTISPLPSFLKLTGDIPDVGTLLGLQNVGVPMPLIGDLYFQMGWAGLSILFLVGWWMGRLEANIILHTRFFGRAYWIHILIWLSLLYAFILSFHSASRGSSRVLIYALFFSWSLNFLVPFLKKGNYETEE